MPVAAALDGISKAFTDARRAAAALPGFPGPLPEELSTAYAIQDRSLASWGDEVMGWKVGMVPAPLRERLGADRLSGPIFRQRFWIADSARPTVVPVFDGGFAAVEAEFVVALAADLPLSDADVDETAADALAGAMHVGVEMAGSPLATINEIGPIAVVSDFGNNAGLILGPEIPDWRGRALEEMKAAVAIDGVEVGTGSAASIPGGPLAAFRFLLNNARRRGIALKAGTLVSTGATTGIHDIRAGQKARIVFDGIAEINCAAEQARP